MLDFGLSDDRAKLIDDLAPGSPERLYFRCLQHQHRGEWDAAQAVLDEWDLQGRGGSGYAELVRRQALLAWNHDPERSQEHVRRALGVHFGHEREVEDEADRYPSALDPSRVTWSALSRGEVQGEGLSGLSPLGVERLARAVAAGEAPRWLKPERLRVLLGALPYADFDELLGWIVLELDDPKSGGFGSVGIHDSLTLPQLEHLAELRPPLLSEGRFVAAWIARILPDESLDDPAVLGPYLERLGAFTERLTGEAFLSLRFEVLHHRLRFARSQGTVSLSLLSEYLSVPRHASFVRREWIQDREVSRRAVSYGTRHTTGLDPVRDDSELVRELLEELLSEVSGPEDPRVRDLALTLDARYLRQRIACAKLLAGAPDPERWAALLDDPGALSALRERVELRLRPENPLAFAREAAVALELDLKRVPELRVKIFRLEVENVFRSTGSEPGLGIDLDGLVPQHELNFSYDEPALRRVRRRYELPQLQEPGLYVVDFIGAGVNSRALIRKGELRVISRPTAAGQAVWVTDEAGRSRPQATLILGERAYQPDPEGRLLIPYTTSLGMRQVVLCEGDLVSAANLWHFDEHFELSARIHVEREQLVAGAQATVLVRALLTLHGAPVSLDLLQEASLRVETTDLRGVSTASDAPLSLSDAQEATHTFRVPEDCAGLNLSLRATLPRRNLEPLQLSAAQSYPLNRIDASGEIRSIYLEGSEEGYTLWVLGKNGEPSPHTLVRVVVQHPCLTRGASFSLQTNAAGRIDLGQLPELSALSARIDGQGAFFAELDRARAQALPGTLHLSADEAIELPYPGHTDARREDLALYRVRSQRGALAHEPQRDRFDALRARGGVLRVEGLEPGAYRLVFKATGREHHLRVGAGVGLDRFRSAASEALELRYQRCPGLQVARDAEGLSISLRNATGRTRVHVFGSAFLPVHDSLEELAHPSLSDPIRLAFTPRTSTFESGRVLGEEVRYVLDRQRHEAVPGNMLTRPGLLLNPWALRTTSTRVRDAAGGAAFGASASAPAPSMSPPRMARGGRMREEHSGGEEGPGFPTLDFLPGPSVQLLNLRPDSSGALRVSAQDLGDARWLRVVVCDGQLAAEESLPLPPRPLEPRDRRLWLGLDPHEHFAEQRCVQVIDAGAELKLDDLTTARLARYDSLQAVYQLYATLAPSPALTTFAFLTRWPELSAAEQEEAYSEHACHELHLFLYFKDRAFFERVIAPYLAHKRDKTFVDRWLLNEDLSPFTTPWAFGRLNAAEKVLLGRRLPAERPRVARHLADLVACAPADHRERARRFDAAIQSQDHGEDGLGIAAAREQVQDARRSAAKSQAREKKKRAAPPSAKSAKSDAYAEECEAMPSELSLDCDDEFGGIELERAIRADQPPLFQPLDTTQELGESDYYRVRPDQLRPDRVPPGPFWRDLATHSGEGPFLSEHLATATSSFTEQVLALAFLGLPFSAPEPEVSFPEGGLRLCSSAAQVAYLQELRPAPTASDPLLILVGQRIVRADEEDTDEDDDDEQAAPRSGPESSELLTRTVYTCQVVLSNPGERERKLELLLQIPRGALPVAGGRKTESRAISLGGFETESLAYSFYFPEPGEFPHFPVQVAYREEVVASAPPRVLQVVAEPSFRDTSSWSYVSQRGTSEEVLTFLEGANLERLDLSRIAWRMSDAGFFAAVIALLTKRHVYCRELWAYGIHHARPEVTRELLLHEDSFLRQAGLALEGELLSVDPLIRGWYQHKEYAPLVNARAHRLGSEHEVLNDGLRAQWDAYRQLMKYRAELSPDDRLALVYYLLVQDRIGEALEHFLRVPRASTACGLQHDYLGAYLAISRGDAAAARALAEPLRDHPVRRWRELFRGVLAVVDELATGRVEEAEGTDRTQRQTKQAEREPSFSLQVEGAKLRIRAQHLPSVELRFYRMDLELLFSLQPFGWTDSGRFAYTAPHRVQVLALEESGERLLSLPAELAGQNVVVEARGGGQREVATIYAHSLVLRLFERFGQLQLDHAQGGALAAVYVKVYARHQDGSHHFFKDGYTDLRGRFDYATLSTDQLSRVERFSLLIASREHGALVREAAPPLR